MSVEPVTQEVGTVLFRGLTPLDMTAAATEATNAITAVIRDRGLTLRISGREYPTVEAWQFAGTLAGVFAVKDGGVWELAWPELAPVPDEPPEPGPEPTRVRGGQETPEWRAWRDADELRDAWRQSVRMHTAQGMGLTYGYTATFRAVKDGRDVGWAEGRTDRSEPNWTMRDNHALASMAQTRAQSRALAAPLRFILKLANYQYETTPAEEMNTGNGAVQATPTADVFLDEEAVAELVAAIDRTAPGHDGANFLLTFMRHMRLDGVPVMAERMLRAWLWWAASDGAPAEPPASD